MTVFAATGVAALASAVLTVGLYYMKREAERLPSLGGGWRAAAWWAFVRDPWWMLGVVLQIVGYALYLVALRGAPLSVVHTALNAGVAFFVVLAVFGLGERLHGLEWAGVVAVVAGLIALGASLSGESVSTPSPHSAGAFSLALVLAAVAAAALDRTPGRALGLSVASGLILGLGGIFAKQLANAPSLSAALSSLALLLTLATNMTGFALMQGAMQTGRGIVVVPIFSVLSNLVPIIGGIVVYSEPLVAEGSAGILRPLAMLLALAGAGVLGARGEVDVPARAGMRS